MTAWLAQVAHSNFVVVWIAHVREKPDGMAVAGYLPSRYAFCKFASSLTAIVPSLHNFSFPIINYFLKTFLILSYFQDKMYGHVDPNGKKYPAFCFLEEILKGQLPWHIFIT